MTIVEIVRKIIRPARMVCEPCGEAGALEEIDAHHTLAPGAPPNTLRHLRSAEHRALLGFSNGFVLFDTEHLVGKQLCDNGLRFFALDEIPDERERFLETMDSDAIEELDEGAEALQKWYEGFVPVAAPCGSGDLIVLDTTRPGPGPEPRVLYLDHEYYYGGPFDESMVERQWPSLGDFLAEFAADPAEFLMAHWRALFDGDPMHQYVPIEVVYSSPE